MKGSAKQVKVRIDGAWRIYLFGLILSLTIAFLALVEARTAQSSLAAADNETEQVLTMLQSAHDISGRLRQYLIADYPRLLADEPAALTRLLIDLNRARSCLERFGVLLSQITWPTIDERIKINKLINVLEALLYYNDTTLGDKISAVEGESKLLLSETMPGSIKSNSSITELGFEDLIRVVYIASVRPSMLADWCQKNTNITLNQETYSNILNLLNDTHTNVRNEFGQRSRERAEKLWMTWIKNSSEKLTAGNIVSRRANINRLESHLFTLVKQRSAASQRVRGEQSITVPGINQHVPVSTAVFFLPLALAGIYILIAVYFWQASIHARMLSVDDDIIDDISSPFILIYGDNKIWMIAAMPLPYIVLILPFSVTFVIGFYSPIMAALEEINVAYWLAVGVEGVAVVISAIAVGVTIKHVQK